MDWTKDPRYLRLLKYRTCPVCNQDVNITSQDALERKSNGSLGSVWFHKRCRLVGPKMEDKDVAA